MGTTKKKLAIEVVRIDGGTQPRAEIDEAIVAEYAADLDGDGELPPVVVFYDGTDYWLADGFHRWHAHRRAVRKTIACEIHAGTLRDAVLYSVGANATHGKRRTNADKRKAVETLLKDAEWGAWSDNVIASKCLVSQRFVSTVRGELTQNGSKSNAPRKGADGRTINTAKIGKQRKNAAPEPPAEPAGEIEFPAEVYADATPAEPEAVSAGDAKDASGQPVPPHLAAVFARRERYASWKQRLGVLESEIKEEGKREDCSAWMNFRELATEARNLNQAVKFAAPYIVCNYCGGRGCQACRHSGYLNESVNTRTEARRK